MTDALIQLLRQGNAFEPQPGVDAIGRLHVPFDRMLGNEQCEQRLAQSQQRGECVALIGGTGSGKTSVIEHVFRHSGVPGLAPISLPVAIEDRSVATEPAQFLRYVIRILGKHARDFLARTRAERQVAEAALHTPGRSAVSRSRELTVGGGLPWLHAELAMQLEAPTALDPPTTQEVIDHARLVMDIIERAGLRPVLVLDDTDHWLQLPGLPPPDELISRFFGEVVRVIAEQLPIAAAIVPVHETYVRHAAFEAARGFLPTQIVLPRIPRAASLVVIVGRRASIAAEREVLADDVLHPAALETLFANYEGGDRDLRKAMTVLHAALVRAADATSDAITSRHVEQAIAETSPPVA